MQMATVWLAHFVLFACSVFLPLNTKISPRLVPSYCKAQGSLYFFLLCFEAHPSVITHLKDINLTPNAFKSSMNIRGRLSSGDTRTNCFVCHRVRFPPRPYVMRLPTGPCIRGRCPQSRAPRNTSLNNMSPDRSPPRHPGPPGRRIRVWSVIVTMVCSLIPGFPGDTACWEPGRTRSRAPTASQGVPWRDGRLVRGASAGKSRHPGRGMSGRLEMYRGGSWSGVFPSTVMWVKL